VNVCDDDASNSAASFHDVIKFVGVDRVESFPEQNWNLFQIYHRIDHLHRPATPQKKSPIDLFERKWRQGKKASGTMESPMCWICMDGGGDDLVQTGGVLVAEPTRDSPTSNASSRWPRQRIREVRPLPISYCT
jgi:hypothetical protein